MLFDTENTMLAVLGGYFQTEDDVRETNIMKKLTNDVSPRLTDQGPI